MANCIGDLSRCFGDDQKYYELTINGDEDQDKEDTTNDVHKSHILTTSVDDIVDFRTSYHFNSIIKHIGSQTNSNTLKLMEIKPITTKSTELKTLSKSPNLYGIKLDNILIAGYDDHFTELTSNLFYNMEMKFIYSTTLFPINEDNDDTNVDGNDQYKNKKWKKTIDGKIWKTKQLNKIQHLLSINTNNIADNLNEMYSDDSISLLSFSDFAALNTITLTQYLSINNINNINMEEMKTQKKKKKKHKYKKNKTPPKPPQNTFYVNDTSMLCKYSVRKGYLKYGTIGYFDNDCKLIGIYVCAYHELYTFNDDDIEWNHAKWIYKVSCFVYIQIYHLFIKCYLIKSLNWNIAIKECLPLNHPIRRLCIIFNIGTVSSINEIFDEFCQENGLFHRLFAFEYKELIRLINDFIYKYQYKSICDELREMGQVCNDSKYPLYNDITEFHDILYKFLNEYMDIYYKTDKDLIADGLSNKFFNKLLLSLSSLDLQNKKANMITILTDLILSAIIIPNICGAHLSYFKLPNFIGLKIKMPSLQNGQETENDIICYIESLIYSLRTKYFKSLQQSKLKLINNNYYKLFLNDKHNNLTKDLWFKFQNNLIKYSQNIRQRNKTRITPFKKCHPQLLNISIIL